MPTSYHFFNLLFGWEILSINIRTINPFFFVFFCWPLQFFFFQNYFLNIFQIIFNIFLYTPSSGNQFRLPGVTESLKGRPARAPKNIRRAPPIAEDPIAWIRQRRSKVVSKDGLQGKDGRRKLLLKLFPFYSSYLCYFVPISFRVDSAVYLHRRGGRIIIFPSLSHLQSVDWIVGGLVGFMQEFSHTCIDVIFEKRTLFFLSPSSNTL
jgi:hypothetical protein